MSSIRGHIFLGCNVQTKWLLRRSCGSGSLSCSFAGNGLHRLTYLPKTCETSFAGTGERPGPSTKGWSFRVRAEDWSMLDAAMRRSRPSTGLPVGGWAFTAVAGVNEDGNIRGITSRGQSKQQNCGLFGHHDIYIGLFVGLRFAISGEPEDSPACAGTDPSMEVEVLWCGFSWGNRQGLEWWL